MDTIALNRNFTDAVKKLTSTFENPELDQGLATMTKCFRTLNNEFMRLCQTLDARENETKALIKANSALADKIEQDIKTLK